MIKKTPRVISVVSRFRALSLLALIATGAVAATTAYALTEEQVEPIDEIFEPQGCYDPAAYARVAVVQWNRTEATPVEVSDEVAEKFKMETRAQLVPYIREAAAHGAEWVITPEFSLTGYPDIPGMPPEETDFRNREDIRPYVEPIPGPSTEFFGKIARELRIYLNIGFAEVDPITDKYYNAVAVLGPDGQVVATYRKMNLYQLENKFLSPGEEPTVFDSPFGRVGIIICADVYSSDPMNFYRKAKVDVLALSTSWAAMNSGMHAFQQGARRVGAYVLAANQHYFPDSGVVNRDGSTQSHIRQSMGVAYGYLPRAVPGVDRGECYK